MSLAVLVIVARQGPAVQGAFVLFVACESALSTLFAGLGLLLAREVSQRKGAVPPGAPRALLAAAVGLGAAAAVVLAGIAAFADDEPYRHLWLLALAAPFLLMVPTATGLWMGQGRMLALNAPLVAGPAAVLVGLLVLTAAGVPPSVLEVLALWAAAKAVVALLTGAAVLREAGPAPADAALLRAQWRFVATLGLVNLVSLANFRATLFVLERLQGLEAAGIYSVAMQAGELLWLLSSSVTTSAYHRIGAPDARKAAKTTVRAVRVNLLATAAAAPLLAAVAWFALPLVLGPAYRASLPPLLWLLPGIAAYAAASSLSAYFTNQRGRPQWSAGIAALSMSVTLGAAFVLIPRLGAEGAALATTLGYAVAITVALHSFLRDAGLPWRALVDNRALPA